ncbi:ethanolamine utilization protein EutH [Anaerovorax odorimutans]|uniref:Ethanolamine utilization protein EutH n=1 Tax=Anaerovorax odorimutans TaxID=109327 RepID=A0ABT1RUJ9_9FIRM|nr:ethanolamine utilization protein EutH [Anaerovorax odorimutans]
MVDHLSFNQIVVDIMVLFMVLGGFDKITKKKFKLGLADEFEEGFHALGALSLSMLGILAFAPVLTKILLTVLGPVYEFLGADPAMMAGSFLGMDMGAYSIAHEMAATEDVANFSGLILGGMMGNTIVFIIPVAISILKKEDYPFMAQGILYGVTTIPVGCIAGGLAAGYELSMILRNLLPIILFAGLIVLGLKLVPEKMIKGFRIFGDLVVAIITAALVCSIVESLTGLTIIPGMAPLTEGFEVVGNIAIMLAGAFPMVYVITKKLSGPLQKLGSKIGINDTAAGGLVASMANNIPMCGMMKDMNVRGKILNAAFMVSGTFIIGDDLAFAASVNREMILPVIVGKGVAGVTAVAVAWFATRKLEEKAEQENKEVKAAA